MFSRPERRRRWSDEERRLILAETFSPGACVAQVARRHGVSTGLAYTSRRKLVEMGREADDHALLAPGFAEATIVEDGEGISADRASALIIDLARGKRVSIFSRRRHRRWWAPP